MRLRRLVLARYGKFTDRTIEFGEAVGGAPDLHVVYGPNEAGKSTLFSAILDLLFGIELQSRYGFLHSYDTMRIAGCLDLSSGPRDLVRIKKPQPTLRDATNQPVAQTLLAGELGGLDRAAYRTMFSLDDETLESGGDSILASNGELGQLLFSASAGLAELSRTLLAIRSTADAFTRPGARSGDLHAMKLALEKLKQERDALDTQATAYAKLAAARDDATKAYAAALAELTARQETLAAVRNRRIALPRLNAWRLTQEKLEGFAALPAVPASWQSELPDLVKADATHRSATEHAAIEVARLTQACAGIIVDAAALARSDYLDHLDALAARDRTATLDLPPRRTDLVHADEAVQDILAQIDRPRADPAQLRLTTAQSTTLDTLLEARSGVEAKLTTANTELVDAVDGLSNARRLLGPNPDPPSAATLAHLTAAVAASRASDHATRLRAGIKARDHHAGLLGTHLAALQPWSGDAAALAALPPPDPAALEAWHAAAETCASAVERHQTRAEDLEAELVQQRAKLAVSSAVNRGDDPAAASRTAREAAWAQHRRTLDASTADAFETALRRDDIAAAARLGHAQDLARHDEAAQAVQVKEAELAAARRRLAEAVASQQGLAAQTAATTAAISTALADLSNTALRAWIAQRVEALATWQQLRDAEGEVRQAQADEATLRQRLQEAMAQAAVPFNPMAAADALAVAGQAGLDREAGRQVLRNAVADCERNVGKREKALHGAAQADRAWHAAWLAACSACWLGAAAAEAPLETVRAVVKAAAGLQAAVAARRSLEGRIADMEADQAAFVREVDSLTAELGIAPAGRAGLELAKEVSDRVREAVRAEESRTTLRGELADAQEAQRKAVQEAQVHAVRVNEMMETLGATSLLEVANRLRDVKDKADLVTQAQEAEREILKALGLSTLAEATAALEGQSTPALEGEAAGLAAQVLDLEGHVRELFAHQQTAIGRIAAIGGDDAAARVEERRRTQLLEIEDKAQHYLRLRVGIAAADRALRAYRDQHRSAMMQEASDAFRLISRGAYRGLGTQPGKDGDILVALGADGGSKTAADLSKGTRFQLYLALRAAGYREFAKLRPTVPFVADDIMETFDDVRAEETLKVLGDMSRLGQVIYLTHHGHLSDIAERTVPGVRLHELTP